MFLALNQNHSDVFTVKRPNFKCAEAFSLRDTICHKTYGKTCPSIKEDENHMKAQAN